MNVSSSIAMVGQHHRCSIASVNTLLRRARGDHVRQRLQVNRPIVQPYPAAVIEPSQGMLEPILVVSLRKILSRMCAAAFGAPDGGVKTDARLREHVVELERLNKVRIEDQRPIADT